MKTVLEALHKKLVKGCKSMQSLTINCMAVRVNRAFCHFWASQTVENSSRATFFSKSVLEPSSDSCLSILLYLPSWIDPSIQFD